MAPKAKKARKPAKKAAAKIAGGRIIMCVLCGQVIKSAPDGASDHIIIYSVCPACKLVPPRGI